MSRSAALWSLADLRWLLWALYLLCWSAALLTPQPVRAADALLPEQALFSSFKVVHVSAYAGLAILTGWLPVRLRQRWLLLLVVSAHAFGTEFFQQFVPERYASWEDVGLDHLGIALGLALSWRWWRPPTPLERLRREMAVGLAELDQGETGPGELAFEETRRKKHRFDQAPQ